MFLSSRKKRAESERVQNIKPDMTNRQDSTSNDYAYPHHDFTERPLPEPPMDRRSTEAFSLLDSPQSADVTLSESLFPSLTSLSTSTELPSLSDDGSIEGSDCYPSVRRSGYEAPVRTDGGLFTLSIHSFV